MKSKKQKKATSEEVAQDMSRFDAQIQDGSLGEAKFRKLCST